MNTSPVKKTLAVLVAAPLIFVSGCTTNKTEQGVAGGAAAGAALGGIIGHQSGETGAGAALGAVLGGLIGGAVGNNAQKKDEQVAADARHRMEMARIERERAAAAVELQRQRQIASGMQASDREVFEAEQAAKEAESRLRQLEAERHAAMVRQQKIEEAERRRLEAERRISELQGVAAPSPTY